MVRCSNIGILLKKGVYALQFIYFLEPTNGLFVAPDATGVSGKNKLLGIDASVL